MPVRIRIALFFTLLVAVILAIVCLYVYYSYATFRAKNIEKKLISRANTFGRLLSQPNIFSNRLIKQIDSSSTPSYTGEVIQAYDYKNEKIYSYNDAGADSLNVSPELLNEARVAGKHFFKSGKKDAVAYYYKNNDLRLVMIAAGEDRDGKQNQRHLENSLLLSFFIGLLITSLGGYFFSSGLLRPVKNIADAVNHISAQNFSERIKTGKARDEWFYLSNTLNALLNRLQDSFDLQKRFIADASHELSTPLTSISNQIEVSLQRERGLEEYQKVLRSVYDDVMQMSHLTKTLLEFAKAAGTPGGIEIDRIRIDEILLRLPAEMSKADDECSVVLEFDELPEEADRLLVLGNEDLLFTAIKNVVSNGCKYSHDKKAVVKLMIKEEEICIHVKDQGVGIPSDEVKKIFQPFYRINNERLSEDGFGLGLSLASRIIKLHKGKIEVTSAVNEGSTFTIHLPIARNA